MTYDVPTVLGVIGMLCILGSFFLLQQHRLSPDDLLYDMLNFIGSTLLIVNAAAAHVWTFAVLNGVFALYSLSEVLKDVRVPRTKPVKSAV